MDNVETIQKKIDVFLEKHPEDLLDSEHAELKELLSKRAEALSEATGMEIHPLFD